MPEGGHDASSRGGRPTMADIAVRLGVSRQLVSMVLRDKPGPSKRTRERVLAAAEELGYHADTVARLLRRARSRQLGVLFTMDHELEAHVVASIYSAAARLDYEIVLSAILPTRGERRAIEDLIGLRCEALILIGLSAVAPEHLATVAEHVPVVEIGQYTGTDNTDSVRTADAQGTRLAVDHLAGLGHRAIVHIDGGAKPGAADRRDGYRDAMRDHGLAEHIELLPGDYTVESGAAAARELLSRDRLPTAVIAGNDLCASGLMETLIRDGVRTPADLSVVGYDDSATAGLSYLNLTSVRQDVDRLASAAVTAASQRLDGDRRTPSHTVVPPTLTIRDSTGPPRRDGGIAALKGPSGSSTPGHHPKVL